MSGKIYLLDKGDSLHPLERSGYEAEAVLQGLLANYPDLLAGDQVNPSGPRRWLLISRELAVAAEEGGAARWAIDHLFIDQEVIPTLVEVKRSTNSQIRREVVGQMLDSREGATTSRRRDADSGKCIGRLCICHRSPASQQSAEFGGPLRKVSGSG